ncbi:hypothetical protein SPBR_05502 [Sporothrix brasiliensis 5110]|uniref:Nuclear pore complex protein Nup85 n=1 Tax=Sporothrix brasiliensis 5110 TaxID=1398154 RepID=A0A0C2IZB8_9PEZI|nr:uncharacterized protein SPBR_05502 [Sporothrix brasiliensis 5110]KIH94466.1 hypothetical protein SPBR_05502 [Sporothrix brasiliensis 5110]
MPNKFSLPDDDDDDGGFSSPATPGGGFGGGAGGGRGSLFRFDGGATSSTTPGGLPPPSSAGSFTPAGAPSASYLGSSMMRGVAGTAKSTGSPLPSTSRNIFAAGGGSFGGFKAGSGGGSSNSPLGRSIQGSKPTFGPGSTRQPSRLSQVMADDDEEDDEEEEEEEEEDEDEENEEEEDEDDDDAEGEDEEDNEAYYRPRVATKVPANRSRAPAYQNDEDGEDDDDDEGSYDDEEDAEGEYDEEEEDENGAGSDPWLDLAQSAVRERASLQGRAPWMPAGGEADGGEGEVAMGGTDGVNNSDLLTFATPAINDRIRKEAEDIFRASAARSGGGSGRLLGGAASTRGPRELKYASIAKSMYGQMGCASLAEAPQLIRQTEVQISKLYSQGVGVEDNADRLDQALADASAQLVALWQAYADSLPETAHSEHDDEQFASIGPGPDASAFENAAYVATVALQLHHTRSTDNDTGVLSPEPLTETLFRWMADYHNVYPDQVHDVLQFQPSPASHGMFWQTVFVSLLQGRVEDAVELLRAGGWDKVRRAGVQAYSGRALSNVERAVQETIAMLDTCPGKFGSWDIWNSEWTLFRIRAKGALDHLRRFAEGGRGAGAGTGTGNDDDDDAEGEDEFGEPYRGGRQSMAGMARKAESQVPWDIYENLNIVFDIALGSRERILGVSQDWCEATLGLFGWWDETKVAPTPNAPNFGTSRHGQSMSMTMTLRGHAAGGLDGAASTFADYLDRLTRSFRATTEAGLEINTNSPLEVALACIFEDNPRGLLGLLRAWSLPVASAVVEIAALGGWLPTQSSTSALATALGGLDMEDLEVLGVDPTDPDESDGFKDNTLVQYAQALINNKELQPTGDEEADNEREEAAGSSDASPANMDGWELAIHVLGRMNSQERAEETIGELVRTILLRLDVDSGATVDKIWRLLSDLGMSSFAEEAAEHYGYLLANKSYRFGEAVWYFAIAHRPGKVREVMNLLISYSLVQSAAYPLEADLDDYLRRLLFERKTSLEQLARRDLVAAELLGRLLSGYATLRHFYNVRDDPSTDIPPVRRRTAAAAALTAVIASADDNIRGGLYDAARDAVVSEDFLLALLGEALPIWPPDATSAGHVTAPPVVAAETVDVLLKAVEDLQTLAGSRVYATCDEFFQVVLASVPGGLKGSSPADLLRKTTSDLSAASGASSFLMTGSSMLASQLHRSMSGARTSAPGSVAWPASSASTGMQRGWDWRSGLPANTTAADVLQRVRVGLSRALARLWVAEADEMDRRLREVCSEAQRMRRKRRVADMEDSETGVAEAIVRAKSEEETEDKEDKEDKEEAHFRLGHVQDNKTERAPVAARDIEGLC